MSGRRRLEWSKRLDAGPTGWTLLNTGVVCSNTEQAPGWFIPRLDIIDQGNQVCLECRFRKWCEEAPGMAVYDAEELDHAAWVNYPAGQIYVREVPPPLMVTCSLSHIESQDFEAIFTTMAGVPLLHIPRVSNPSSSMEQLAADAACAAVAQGRLQSRNREVCTLLEGQTEPLGILTVSDFLWDKLTKPRDAAE